MELPAAHTLRADEDGKQRATACHEQAVALDAAKAEVGTTLRQRDLADPLAGSVEDCGRPPITINSLGSGYRPIKASRLIRQD